MRCVLCDERFVKGSNISFHIFPKDEKQKTLWLKACDLDEWDITPHSKLCSKHFNPEDIESDKDYRHKRLKNNSVPRNIKSLKNPRKIVCPILIPLVKQELDECDQEDAKFDHSYAINYDKLSKLSLCSKCGSSVSTEVSTKSTQTLNLNVTPKGEPPLTPFYNVHSPEPETTPRYIGDFKAQHFSTPEKATRNLYLMKDIFGRQQQKIKNLQQKRRRMEARLASVAALLQKFKTSDSVSGEAFTKLMGLAKTRDRILQSQ